MALGARGKRAADLAAVSAARAMADAYPRLFEPPAYLTALPTRATSRVAAKAYAVRNIIEVTTAIDAIIEANSPRPLELRQDLGPRGGIASVAELTAPVMDVQRILLSVAGAADGQPRDGCVGREALAIEALRRGVDEARRALAGAGGVRQLQPQPRRKVLRKALEARRILVVRRGDDERSHPSEAHRVAEQR
jgi:hypothetical protein